MSRWVEWSVMPPERGRPIQIKRFECDEVRLLEDAVLANPITNIVGLFWSYANTDAASPTAPTERRWTIDELRCAADYCYRDGEFDVERFFNLLGGKYDRLIAKVGAKGAYLPRRPSATLPDPA